jgi:hypothetical protein
VPVPQPHTPAASFAAILRGLVAAVAARTGWSLTLLLIGQITDRLRRIRQRFACLAERIAAGRYAPRQNPTAPRPPR